LIISLTQGPQGIRDPDPQALLGIMFSVPVGKLTSGNKETQNHQKEMKTGGKEMQMSTNTCRRHKMSIKGQNQMQNSHKDREIYTQSVHTNENRHFV